MRWTPDAVARLCRAPHNRMTQASCPLQTLLTALLDCLILSAVVWARKLLEVCMDAAQHWAGRGLREWTKTAVVLVLTTEKDNNNNKIPPPPSNVCTIVWSLLSELLEIIIHPAPLTCYFVIQNVITVCFMVPANMLDPIQKRFCYADCNGQLRLSWPACSRNWAWLSSGSDSGSLFTMFYKEGVSKAVSIQT